MIKNRESAARSRLKRQLHTTQLEQENQQLQAQVASLTAQVGGQGWVGRVCRILVGDTACLGVRVTVRVAASCCAQPE